MRDFQRARVYRAENQVARGQVSMLELDALAQTLRQDFAFPFTLGYAPPYRLQRCAGGYANPARQLVVLGDGNHSPFDLLHEFGHLLAERGHSGQKHGPLWVGMYVELVRRYMGDGYGDRLLSAFESGRVRWTTPYRLLEPLIR